MALIGSSIKSKFTGNNGIITGIDKKKLTVTFTYGGNIDVPLQKHEELFYMADETRDEINQFIEAQKKPRKQKEAENL
ncbi:MAG: hypothetical protein IJI92_00125 [Erysipelotrichaceae bacterium]|nr:hypothetical protein [Erysipelotrichaceae bacterium]